MTMELTIKQRRFKEEIVDRLPELDGLFDWSQKEYNIQFFERIKGSYSHGQVIMARFAVAVWLGDNEAAEFDIIEALKVLDEHRAVIVVNWIRSPFWP